MHNVNIGSYTVGPGQKPFIICEISANHNGSLEKALQLINAAIETGCDAIKLQTYTPETMTMDIKGEDFYIGDGPWAGNYLYDLYKSAHTPYEWHQPIFERARAGGVEIFSTPFDKTAVDLLSELKVSAFKIASFELTDLPLIKYAASKMKPLIISTGLGSLHDISAAIEAAQSVGNSDIVLLHCISSYPAPIEECNINTIEHMSKTFGLPVGLSDHTLSNTASITAVARGACVIEKHFTLDRKDIGPDSAFSLEPSEFKALVNDCANSWKSLGTVNYKLKPSEKLNLSFRRSIYFCKDMKAGEKISETSIRIIRPGFGLPPSEFERLIGRTLANNVTAGTAVSFEHFI